MKFTEKSPLVLQEYCREVGINLKECSLEFDEINENLHLSFSLFKSKVAQKVVFIELVGLFFADGQISKQEEAIIKEMKSYFEISDEIADSMINIAKDMLEIYFKAEKIIHE